MTLSELQEQAYATAYDKGWHEETRERLEIHALIHSEISEATECVRAGDRPLYYCDSKPCGEAVELADAVIRIADYFHENGWDLDSIVQDKMEFNKTRPHRHGGKVK